MTHVDDSVRAGELHHPAEQAGGAIRRRAAQHLLARRQRGCRRRPAVAVPVPRQHRRQRPVRLLLAEQHAVGRRQAAVFVGNLVALYQNHVKVRRRAAPFSLNHA